MGKRVLIVDDAVEIGKIISDILEGFDYKPVVCESAEEAIPHIREVDFLVTDFNMPGMNGAELARIAKLQKPSIRVAIMSGNVDDIPNYHRADKIIPKPFSTEKILRFLES